ncbi:MAG: hypothetical protein ACQEWI_00090 [Bacillota bacterium]
MLEETLYTRYYSYLLFRFYLVSKIDKIERIDGDTRRHKVYASALNYDGHHSNVPLDKILITLTDTPKYGVKINKVTIQKGISEIESLIQCRRENKNLVELMGTLLQ